MSLLRTSGYKQTWGTPQHRLTLRMLITTGGVLGKQSTLRLAPEMKLSADRTQKPASTTASWQTMFRFAVVSCGRIGHGGRNLIQILTKRLKVRTGGNAASFNKSLYADIACAICTGNASIGNRAYPNLTHRIFAMPPISTSGPRCGPTRGHGVT